ncbi:hypothetical protein [Planctomicrobium sp. SH664]|uniref:hypothetical protein n=1 Tax=Planctomicrobium sp. SH664 TaxID=3448125 RepID=UPI003F5B58B7
MNELPGSVLSLDHQPGNSPSSGHQRAARAPSRGLRHWAGRLCLPFTVFSLAAMLHAQTPPPPQPDPQQFDALKIAPEIPGVTDNAPDVNPPGLEVLTRGPVHEAFAAHSVVDVPVGAEPIDKAPPEPINELPPDVMPDGENVEWIPGYWDWDFDRKDFIWVSGLWRDVPPGQRWIPGYFAPAGQGWQRVPGFWTADSVAQISYLPEPPATQESGPNIEAPGENYFWVPGSWVYQNQYQWQPGYWAPCQDQWVWVPSQYYWTPSGYVYTAGYWDYPVSARGTLFCPVYAPNYTYGVYTPRNIVPVGPLLINLFVRRGYSSYYFGNYYGSSFAGIGIYPWINAPNFYGNRYYYDPLYSYYRYGGSRRGTLDRLRGWNRYYDTNPDMRPPITLAQSVDWRKQMLNSRNANPQVVQQALLGASLREVSRDRNLHQQFGNIRFRELEKNQLERVADRSRELRDLQRNRHQVELASRSGENGPGRGEPLNRNDRDRPQGGDGVKGDIRAAQNIKLDLPKLDRSARGNRSSDDLKDRADNSTPGRGKLPTPPSVTRRIDRESDNKGPSDSGKVNEPGGRRNQDRPADRARSLEPGRTSPGRNAGDPGTGKPPASGRDRENPTVVPGNRSGRGSEGVNPGRGNDATPKPIIDPAPGRGDRGGSDSGGSRGNPNRNPTSSDAKGKNPTVVPPVIPGSDAASPRPRVVPSPSIPKTPGTEAGSGQSPPRRNENRGNQGTTEALKVPSTNALGNPGLPNGQRTIRDLRGRQDAGAGQLPRGPGGNIGTGGLPSRRQDSGQTVPLNPQGNPQGGNRSPVIRPERIAPDRSQSTPSGNRPQFNFNPGGGGSGGGRSSIQVPSSRGSAPEGGSGSSRGSRSKGD